MIYIEIWQSFIYFGLIMFIIIDLFLVKISRLYHKIRQNLKVANQSGEKTGPLLRISIRDLHFEEKLFFTILGKDPKKLGLL